MIYTVDSQVLNLCIQYETSVMILTFSLQYGTTSLYVASQKGHSDVVNTLIRNGADVSMVLHVRHY